jgi:putative oxidoreductase
MTTMNSSSSHPSLSMADALAANTADFVLLCGRILLGWVFVRYGYGKLFDIAGYSASFPPRGLASWLAYIAVPVEFFGGIALLLGVATRYVIGVMLIFMLVATFSSHAFWTMTDAARRGSNEVNFYKNLSMIGGFLLLFVTGPGRFSVDRLLAPALGRQR